MDSPPDARIPAWLIVALVLVMLAGAGLVAVVLVGQGDSKETDGPSYPAAWDARVEPFVKVVEEQRDLTFLHPVEVRFLTGKAFEQEVTTDKEDLDADEREEIEQFSGLLRALGLVAGDVDLLEAFNQAYGAGTLAYYSFEDERITVRGTKVTRAVRATLVHELTHALQDQRFDVGARVEELTKAAEDTAEDGERAVLDAIIEGDAERVATRYRESLGAKERKALDAAESKDQAAIPDGLEGVPKVVLSIVGSPYALGEAMVQAVAEDGGNDAVDELYRDTPKHDEVLLDPFRLLEGDTDARDVDLPDLAEGEDEFDSGEFGALTWYFMLAERIPVVDALAVTDGWGGDAYVGFERDGRTCARVAYAGDTDADTTRMWQALQRWKAATRGSAASVELADGEVRFESCDPGTAARVGNDASMQALELAATRTYLGVGLLQAGADAAVAQCFAREAAVAFPLAELNNPATGEDPAFRSRIQQLVAGCR